MNEGNVRGPAMADRDGSLHGPWRAMLVDDPRPLPFVLAAVVLVAAAGWLLAAPDRIVSRQMTWDMLFNLAGAWHLHNGHVAHVDFHDPLGVVTFLLTAIGFRLTGPSVWGFIAGEVLAAAVLGGAAIIVALTRLAFVPGLVFVAFTCLLVLAPTNVGESVNVITFAMSYNAIGWAALGVFSLILFLPPRRALLDGWVDVAVGGALVLGLYHLKITYFGAAMGELAVALVVSEPIRRVRWCVAGVALAAYAVAPYNWAYLGDVLSAVGTGAVNSDARDLVVMVFDNVAELALVAIAGLAAIALWRSGQVSARLPAAIVMLIASAVAIMSQNTQERGLTLSVALAFLLYDHFRGDKAGGRASAPLWVLLALLIFPLITTSKKAASLAIYHWQAVQSDRLFVFEQAPLRGLAIPAGTPSLLEAVGRRRVDHTMFNRIRAVDTDNEQISQFEYGQTLVEAATLFATPERREGTMVVLDQINPLPFMLGRVPLRGQSLWLALQFPWPPAQDMFADAAYVMIPKFPISLEITRTAIERYGAYLEEHFPARSESASWFLLARR